MIKNIYCIGRNYLAHAEELGNRVGSEPVVFLKPTTSLAEKNVIHLPLFSKEIHFETELVVAISEAAFRVEKSEAHKYYDRIAVGLDMTARDLQERLKEKKLPWLLSKGFKDSCYISNFIQKDKINKEINFEMKLNGVSRQKGNSNKMIFGINEIISFISQYIELVPGDVIFTGTPEGVGVINSGDEISLHLENKLLSTITVI